MRRLIAAYGYLPKRERVPGRPGRGIRRTRGEVRRAARLWGAAEALRETKGLPQPPDDKEILAPFLEATRRRLNEALGYYRKRDSISLDRDPRIIVYDEEALARRAR